MRAILLAAGLGTRLRPITDSIPKCLVPINAKPLLEYWLDNLYEAGIREFLINTHYLHEQVEKYIENSKYKKFVTLVYEEDLLLTGGTILTNKSFFKDESFMVIHADNLCFCDFKAFMQSHQDRQKDCVMTMMTFKSDNPQSCGVVKLNSENVVTEFYEKVKNPPTDLANGAVYIFEPEIFEILSSLNKKEIDLSTEILPKLTNKINSYLNDVYLKDIGTLKSYALSQIDVLKFTK